MQSIFLLFSVLFSLLALCMGFLMLINPALAIELQRRAYEKINWSIEPISVSKEIRNTRIMGWITILLVIAALFIALTRPAVM
jgi:magnesium-transporting ATPase (P-type)